MCSNSMFFKDINFKPCFYDFMKDVILVLTDSLLLDIIILAVSIYFRKMIIEYIIFHLLLKFVYSNIYYNEECYKAIRNIFRYYKSSQYNFHFIHDPFLIAFLTTFFYATLLIFVILVLNESIPY